MYSPHFLDRAHDPDPQGDVHTENPDPPSIFLNDAVRTTVAKNLVDLRINADTAASLLRVRGHAVESLVRAEFPAQAGRWEMPEVLARWIDTHELVGTYCHHPESYTRCILAMALRGDEDFSSRRGSELLGLRTAYEVNLALTKLLRMDAFLAEARAVGRVWSSLLWPVVEKPWDSRFILLVRRAFASRLGLPHHDAPMRFYQEFLRDLARSSVGMPDQWEDKLTGDAFRQAIQRRFRHLIPGDWPDGTDECVRGILLSRAWEGQERAEIRCLCERMPSGKNVTMAELDAYRAIMRAATDADAAARRLAHDAIHAWLVETHPELAEFVRPLRARD
ncbi:hypothetical protein EBS80_00705 [bacterium]|nr:hypothetical protein [bacterium]